MPQQLYRYLVFGCRVGTLFLMFVVANNGEIQQEEDSPQENDNRMNPAYLNPDLYRDGIASLVSAKERAEELLYKNDIIAKLVTEMPYHDIQNRLLVSGNHKEENRSFFEKLSGKKKQMNCGKGFDIYKLLNVVQKSRERAENQTMYYNQPASTKAIASSPKSEYNSPRRADCTVTETTPKCPLSLHAGPIQMVEVPDINGYEAVSPSEANSLIPLLNLPRDQLQIQPTTILYYERFQTLVNFPVHKGPPRPEVEIPMLNQDYNDLLLQPKEDKPPMLIPILEKPHNPFPLKHLPKAIGTEPNVIGASESNENLITGNGFPNFKKMFLHQKSRSL